MDDDFIHPQGGGTEFIIFLRKNILTTGGLKNVFAYGTLVAILTQVLNTGDDFHPEEEC